MSDTGQIKKDIDTILAGEPIDLREAAIEEVDSAARLPNNDRDLGALQRAEKASGILSQEITRRRVVNAGLIGAIMASVGAAETAIEILDNWRGHNESTYGITSAFAAHISTVDYFKKNLVEGYQGTANAGETAVINSIEALGNRNYGYFPIIHNELEIAAELSPTAEGRAIALSRLAIDRSFLGDGHGALAALMRIEFSSIVNQKIAVRLLDLGSSVALNSMGTQQFREMASPAFRHIGRGWSDVGITETNPAKIAALSSTFGVGVFSIAQWAAITRLKQCLEDDPSAATSARNDWAALIKETMHHIDITGMSDKDQMGFAKDCLFSLHRPAFHAAAAGQHDQVHSMLDFYFGRNSHGGRAEHIVDRARFVLKEEFSGSSPWMFLLDITYNEKNHNSKIILEKLLNRNKAQSLHLRRAISDVALAHGYGRRQLNHVLGSEATRELPHISMHQAYMAQIGRQR